MVFNEKEKPEKEETLTNSVRIGDIEDKFLKKKFRIFDPCHKY